MKCNSTFCSINEGFTDLINEGFTDLLKGNKGIQGPTGVHGHGGDTGLRGLDGQVGIQGPHGDKGIPGLYGFKGNQGEQGNPGQPGQRGKFGAEGQIGIRGAKGPRGPKGPRPPLAGTAGAEGPAGELGPSGEKGTSGVQFSNIGVELDDSCTWQTIIDYNPSMAGYPSKSYNYCKLGYGLAGIKTFGWDNDVKVYGQMIESYWYKSNSYWTTEIEVKGKQIQREYEIKCCPMLSAENIVENSKNDNLDDYKNYDSIRKYPFHEP